MLDPKKWLTLPAANLESCLPLVAQISLVSRSRRVSCEELQRVSRVLFHDLFAATLGLRTDRPPVSLGNVRNQNTKIIAFH